MRKVNAGCKTSLQWPELKCAGCGNSWTGGKEPTICIACLNPTCCAECHLQLQHQDICTFYQNFTPIYEVYESINGFRALLHRSILAAGTGQKVTYASPRFLSAQKQDSSHILLERGFRQYGSPVAGTQEFMKLVEEHPDYEHRTCTCTCEKCRATAHPVYNCTSWCLNSDTYKMQFKECWCICSVCIQAGPHTLKDCFYTCKLVKLDNTKN